MADLCVVALDEKSYLELRKRKVKSVLMELPHVINPTTKELLWTHRVKLIKELIQLDIDVLHSDADAFWLKNINTYLEKNEADLIFSIAHRMPYRVVLKWGFIMCCGFFEIRSNNNTKIFMADYLEKSRESGDDQRAINFLLLEKGVLWEQRSTDYNNGVCEHYDISIDVISKEIVSRETGKNLNIFHPNLLTDDISKKLLQAHQDLEACGIENT